ncbi:MAG TPA: FecR family protein [Candidatus Hypogeohydataceae bacterium YC41]
MLVFRKYKAGVGFKAGYMLLYRFIPFVLFLCLLSAWAFAQPLEVTIKEVDGDVEVRFPDKLDWEKAAVGMRLKEGVEVRTGPFSHATLDFQNLSTCIIDSFSYLTIDKFLLTPTAAVTRLNLKVGAIISNVKPDAKLPADYKVITPTLVASVRGTEIKEIKAGRIFPDEVKMGQRGKLEVSDKLGNIRFVSAKENTDTKLTRSADLFTRDSIVHFSPLGVTNTEAQGALHNFARLSSLDSDLAQNLVLPNPSNLAENLGIPLLGQAPPSPPLFSDNFSNGLGNWNSSNAFVANSFGPLTSPDNSPFAVIHTGFGGGEGGNNAGLLSRGFNLLTPSDLNFGFQYNFITTEFPQYVGSQFNDFFIAEVHTPNTGSAVGQGIILAHETVNSSTFTPVSGLPNVLDLSTGGQTGWKTVNTPLSIPSGPSELHYHVHNVGDNSHDSAVLLDNVEVRK